MNGEQEDVIAQELGTTADRLGALRAGWNDDPARTTQDPVRPNRKERRRIERLILRQERKAGLR